MRTRRVFKGRRKTQRGGLRMTAEAEYSITKPKDSVKLLHAMKKVLKTMKDKTITDATANVGGDTVAFAKHFQSVNAIELKDDNFEALQENTRKLRNVTLHKGDSTKLFDWKTDVLYIDAPWGGPDYKTKKNLDLFLGEKRVDEWISEVLKRENPPMFVFLKVPFNYNFSRFAEYEKFKIGKFYLLSLPVYTFITLPKNTFLFRVVENPLTDFAGPLVDEKHCMPKHYNVFFYTNPFAVDIFPEYLGHVPEIQVYKTTRELKILSLIQSSRYTRGSRLENNGVITSCNKHKACIKGRPYDACFTDSFLEKHSDVSGWVGVGKNDGLKIKEALKNNLKDVARYILLVSDRDGVLSSPEIALYPLQERQNEFTISKPIEWMKDQTFNYERVTSLQRDHSILKEFLDTKAKQNDFYFLEA